MTLRHTIMSATLLLGLALPGCASHAYVVRSAPPPPRYGPVGVAPGPRYIWADGYWDWRGNRWRWVPGRWVVPPRHRTVWVPGHWTPDGRHGYRWRAGYWR